MVYVEFLRNRRALTWHLGILAVVTLFALSVVHDTSIDVDGQSRVISGTSVSLGMLAPIAMFFAAIYASSLGTSLNRENVTRDISWTKPVSRRLIALQYVLVDVVGIGIVFAFAMLAVFVVLLRIHVAPVIDDTFVPQLLLGAGVAAMWYGLLQLLTCCLGPGARSLGGLLWPAALVALALHELGGVPGAIVRAVNVINPLAYMSGVSFSAHGAQQTSLWQLPPEPRALVVWVLAAVFCAIAISLWPRKEA